MSEADVDGKRTNGAPSEAALGCGPNEPGRFSQADYHHPAAAWGAAKSVGLVLLEQGELINGTRAVFRMNHENGGFDCPGCAWPDDRKGLHMDICENGIKHVTWEMTRKRVTREFFAAHTVSELMGWSDFALENEGRLTEPMAYNSATDRYEPISWSDAFAPDRSKAPRVAEPAPGFLLHLGAAEQRGHFPLSVVRPRVRHQQLARLLEYVPRGQRAGADGRPGHRQGNRGPRRLAEGGRDFHHRRERRLQYAADADRPGRRGQQAGVEDRPRQPARGSGGTAGHHAARDRQHAALPFDADEHAEPVSAGRRRLGAHAGNREARVGGEPNRPARHRPSVHRTPHGRLRRLPQRLRGRLLGRTGTPVGRARRPDSRRRRDLPAGPPRASSGGVSA